jgi:hypothetical protein
VVRFLTPLPMPLRGLPLVPDDAHDPDVYRVDLSGMGMQPVRVVFGRGPDGRVTMVHTDLGGQPWSPVRRDDGRPWRWLVPGVGALVVMGTLAAGRRGSRRKGRQT